jgi:PAS domain S-box-containing protein
LKEFVSPDRLFDKLFSNPLHRNFPVVKKLRNEMLRFNRFQNYILNLSSSFIKIPFSQIDEAIQESLKDLCMIYDFDHASVWRFSACEIECLYHTNNHHIDFGHGGVDFPYDQVKDILDLEQPGSPVFIQEDVCREQHMPFYSMIKKSGIKSLYLFPLINEGVNIGVFVLGTHKEEKLDENIRIAGQLFCSLITSVLIRKDQEILLKDSFENNKHLMDSINEGVAFYDREGNVLFLNEYILNQFGNDVVIGSNIKDQADGDHEELCRARVRYFEKAVTNNEIVTFEDNLNGCWYNNRLYPISSNGNVNFVTVITEDITEKKKAEMLEREALVLKEKEQEYLQIIDGSSIASWIHDLSSGSFRLSQEWKKRIGAENVSETDMVAYYDTIIHPDDLITNEQRRNRLFEKRQEKFKHSFRIMTVDGSYIWVSDQGKIIYNDDGTPSKVYGTTMDVDEAKRFEEALKGSEQHALELIKELQKADKNKNEFLSILSHELRNPLAAIMTGLSLIEISTDLQYKDKIYRIIDRQTKQLCRLVDDLLDLTRINNNKIVLKKETVDLGALVTNTYNDLKPLFDKKTIDFQLKAADIPVLSADPVRVKQIIENLLYNALNYTSAGGRVFLIMEKNGQEAVITVRDTGDGLDASVIASIFEPFVQVDHSLDKDRSGLGLGLVIVKTITELHGGRVEAFSEGLGKGSEFRIRLPMDTKPDIGFDSSIGENRSGRKLEILFIEDNKDFALLFTALLQDLGHAVVYTSSSSEGISKARSGCFDAVICDIGLPDIDGYDVAGRIKSRLKDACPVLIALTGYAGSTEKQRALDAGFDYHLSKPVDFKVLEKLLLFIDRR